MYFLFVIFFLGLAVGSFLNAVIWRLETGESIAAEARRISRGTTRNLARSYCPYCRTTLCWYDLVPVLSFLFLKGRCRYCQERISLQYPLIEITTGLLFIAIINFQFPISNFQSIFQFSIFNWVSFCYMLYIVCSMIVIFVYDFKHYIIPDKILFPTIIISFFYRIYEALIILPYRHAELVSASQETLKQVQGDKSWVIENWQGLFLYMLAALMASGFFLALVFISRGKWLGLGDVKFTLLMGLVLGWPNILVALFLSFILGAILGLALIFASSIYRHRKSLDYSLKSQIPFGPFLIAGTFVALFWGQRIVEWYLGLLF